MPHQAPVDGTYLVEWIYRTDAPGLYGWTSKRLTYATREEAEAAFEAKSPYGRATKTIRLYRWIGGKLVKLDVIRREQQAIDPETEK